MTHPAHRALSVIEGMLWRADQVMRANFVAIAEVEGPLDEAALRAGLDAAQARHPLLQVLIDGSDPWAPRFAPTARPIPLVVHHAPASDPWPGGPALDAELNDTVDWVQGPLARVVWVQHGPTRSRLIVTLHHAIGDGRSGVLLAGDIVRGAAAALQGSSTALVPLREAASCDARLPPEAHRLRALGPWLGQTIKRDVWGMLRARRFPLDAKADLADRVVRVRCEVLDAEATGALAARARARSTTLHGVLGACLLQSIAAHIGRPTRLGLGTPVDLRRSLAAPADGDVGFFIGAVMSYPRVEPGAPLWPLARAITDDVRAQVERGVPVSATGFLRRVGRLFGLDRPRPAVAAQRVYRGCTIAAGVTNIGRIRVEAEHGPLRIRALHFAVNPTVLADFTSAATGFDGRLHWNFTQVMPAVSDDTFAAVVDGTMARLRRAAESG